jgi:hypothetical protein
VFFLGRFAMKNMTETLDFIMEIILEKTGNAKVDKGTIANAAAAFFKHYHEEHTKQQKQQNTN